ncbi:MAG TPA: ATP-binding protein [Xanthobacteraceae bacterium]|nr:ATP-binding protein [Xanthobacteraceae bacterium]
MAFDELRLEPQLSEIPRLIEWVEARCAAAGVGGEVAMKLALVLEEAVANVINHGLPGSPPPHRVAVRLEIDADTVAAEVIDNGRPFDPTGAPRPDLSLPLEERQPGGLGIHLMRELMDGLDYRRSGDRNILRLHKARR